MTEELRGAGKGAPCMHSQVPTTAQDGDRFACKCGYAAEFVVLDDGLPGEWVSVTSPGSSEGERS